MLQSLLTGLEPLPVLFCFGGKQKEPKAPGASSAGTQPLAPRVLLPDVVVFVDVFFPEQREEVGSHETRKVLRTR